MFAARDRRRLRHGAGRWLAEHALIDLVPIAAVVLVGAVTIGLSGGKSRGLTHLVLLSLTMVESAVALYFRRRHPVAALVGVLAVYAVFQVPPTMVLPVLLALLTVVVLRPGRVLMLAAFGTAVVVIGRSYVDGQIVDVLGEQLPLLLAIGVTVLLGIYLRARRPGLQRVPRETSWSGAGTASREPAELDGAGDAGQKAGLSKMDRLDSPAPGGLLRCAVQGHKCDPLVEQGHGELFAECGLGGVTEAAHDLVAGRGGRRPFPPQ